MFDLVPFGRRHGLPKTFREMDDLFKRVWHEFPFTEHAADFEGEWLPRLDISEGAKEITVRAELPGLEQKDLDISLDGDFLTIKGEKKKEHEETDKHFHRVERTFGTFSRTLRLPTEIETTKVDASFKNGILTIVLPKTKESQKKITHVKVH